MKYWEAPATQAESWHPLWQKHYGLFLPTAQIVIVDVVVAVAVAVVGVVVVLS